GQLDPVDDGRRRGDQVEVELTRQALLHDLEMEEAEKAAAEAEAERRAGLHLEGEGGIVQAQLADGGAQILEIRRIDGKDAAEDDRLRRAEAWQRLGRRLAVVGDGVADTGVGDLADRGGEKAELA